MLLVTLAASLSCGGAQKLELGATCALNSDCVDPLVCKFQACHRMCVRTKDCPSGESCVQVAGIGVCQLPAEAKCTGSCPAPLTCASDDHCRNSCGDQDGCLGGQACVAQVCVESAEPSGGDASPMSTPDAATADAPADGAGASGDVPESCKSIKAGAPSSASGMYRIDPNGPPSSDAMQVYCDMQTNGGGWTKVNDLSEANINRLRGDLGRQMIKCAEDTNPHVISPPFSADWSWMRSSFLQVGGTWIVNGEPQSCGTDREYTQAPCNTWWGVGCGNGPGGQNKLFPGVLSSQACGGRTSAATEAAFTICGSRDFQGYSIFVRAEDIRASRDAARPSCKAILAAQPSSPSGLYWIDPNGPPATDAHPVYCDMQTSGGGWTKVNDLADADVNLLRGAQGRQMLKCADDTTPHIISPVFSASWSWARSTFLQIGGSWIVNGANQSCGTDPEYTAAPCNTWWGAGCGNGPGDTNKLFPGVLSTPGQYCADRISAATGSTFAICGSTNYRSYSIFVRSND
jgi:hypothetical protein